MYVSSAGALAAGHGPADSRWPLHETITRFDSLAGGLQSTLASAGPHAERRPTGWSLLDLTTPIRSQIFFGLMGDILHYCGANEANLQAETIRCVCREFRDQIDEECMTFNYEDDPLKNRTVSDSKEIRRLNCCLRCHPRLRYFECLLRKPSKLRALLEGLQLPAFTRCSFVFEFKITADEALCLLNRFRVRRLSLMPNEPQATSVAATSPSSSSSVRPSRAFGGDWQKLPDTGLDTLCLRGSSNETIVAFLRACPRLQNLQVADCRLLCDPGVSLARLTNLCLTGITSMPDEEYSRLIAGCVNLRSLYISKCHISRILVALPRLELLSITHCRQLCDQCASELVQPSSNPALRYLDLTEDRSLVSPSIAHPGLEIAWLMHCPQLTDQAVTHMFESCPSIALANLIQSSIESALICSPALRTLELTTSQKLTDAAVTHLLQHCPSLTFLDVGHCCQLSEPIFAHAMLETVLLSFCVNLKEATLDGLFAHCPSLRYVELAVSMFDMSRFQSECPPNCQVIVNFDF